MANWYAQYPASASGSNASVGVNGAPIPADSTQVGAEDPSGNLQPLQVDSSGNLKVSIGATVPNPLPVTDAAAEASLASIDSKVATAANQTSQITQETAIAGSTASIDTKTPALGQAVMASSVPVAIASDQSAIPVAAASLPLPTGAATAANQTSQITQETATATSVASIDTKTPTVGQKAMAASSPVALASDQSAIPVNATIQAGTAIIGKVSIDQTTPGTTNGVQVNAALPAGSNIIGKMSVDQTTPGTTNGVVVNSSALPTGAATSALQTTISGQLPATLGQKAMASSMAVTIASDQSAIPTTSTAAGYSKANAPTYLVYSSTNVTTSAYVQLVASTTSATKQIQIFDSSGQAMIIATGAAASEVDQIYVPPGGGIFNLAITASTRVSIKALTATANTGYLLVDYLG